MSIVGCASPPRTPTDHRRAPGACATATRPKPMLAYRPARGSVGELALLTRARRGDRHAERRLIELHEPLARQVCRGFFLANGESADLLQAARFGLWQAIHGWEPLRGASFRAFALLVMRREVMMLVSSSRCHSQRLLNDASSLDRELGTEGGLSLAETLAAPPRDANDPAELLLARERLELILAALPALSEHERSSLKMTLNGLSHTEIGSSRGAGAKSVNNALQRARRKLGAVL
jgi:RNA polymerase sporulation-specific sigma factor